MGPGHSDPPTLALKNSEHPFPCYAQQLGAAAGMPYIHLCSSQHSKASKEKVREEFDPPLLTAPQNQAPRLCAGGNKQQHGLGSKCPGLVVNGGDVNSAGRGIHHEHQVVANS